MLARSLRLFSSLGNTPDALLLRVASAVSRHITIFSPEGRLFQACAPLLAVSPVAVTVRFSRGCGNTITVGLPRLSIFAARVSTHTSTS